MKVEETFDVACPTKDMYRQLNDVGGIGTCIAGVNKVTVESADESTWEIAFRAGPMQRTVRLNARILERDPPTRIAFGGEGQDVEIIGHVDLKAVDEASTRCTVVIESNITGPLGPLVELMAKGPQKQLILETIANLRKRLEGDADGGRPESAEVRLGVLARLSRALSRLRPSKKATAGTL